MGVLDDAIREHLELKRRHGASDDDLSRQEAEALGPARRDVGDPAPAGLEEDASRAEEAAPGLDETGAGLEQPTAAPVAEEHDWAEAEAEAHDDVAVAPPVEAPPVQETPVEVAPVEDELEPEAEELEPEEERGEPDGEPEAERPEPEDELDPDADPDVLEETPDFLQETPEHDRLWFEQKPPRDFDFDE